MALAGSPARAPYPFVCAGERRFCGPRRILQVPDVPMTPDDLFEDDDLDPDRLVGCEYWRCDEIFEQRTANHRFCRKACRSRQRKWERAQERKQAREAARAARSRNR